MSTKGLKTAKAWRVDLTVTVMANGQPKLERFAQIISAGNQGLAMKRAFDFVRRFPSLAGKRLGTITAQVVRYETPGGAA